MGQALHGVLLYRCAWGRVLEAGQRLHKGGWERHKVTRALRWLVMSRNNVRAMQCAMPTTLSAPSPRATP